MPQDRRSGLLSWFCRSLPRVSLAVNVLRVAMIALNVEGVDAALGIFTPSTINAPTFLKPLHVALAAGSQAIADELSAWFNAGRSFVEDEIADRWWGRSHRYWIMMLFKTARRDESR